MSRRRNRTAATAILICILLIAYGVLRDRPPRQPAPNRPLPERLVGRVVDVGDGDTITILVDASRHRVRLYGIDCPELNQPWGAEAKSFTREVALGKTVTVAVRDVDPYGRVVGLVTLPDDVSLNRSLVRDGHAWWYRHFAPKDKAFEADEAAARREKRGLWQHADTAVPPWDWRRGTRR